MAAKAKLISFMQHTFLEHLLCARGLCQVQMVVAALKLKDAYSLEGKL